LETPPDRLSQQLQRERKNLTKTSNPVSRVKILIRISDALLALVGHSAAAGDTEGMKSNLSEYTKTIENSHDTLRDSGRNARSKSDGFLDLEIALRRQLRQLEDIRQTLTVDDRETLSVVIVRASAIRNSILEAVMGGRNGPSIQ
jgi:hypothetical protein